MVKWRDQIGLLHHFHLSMFSSWKTWAFCESIFIDHRSSTQKRRTDSVLVGQSILKFIEVQQCRPRQLQGKKYWRHYDGPASFMNPRMLICKNFLVLLQSFHQLRKSENNTLKQLTKDSVVYFMPVINQRAQWLSSKAWRGLERWQWCSLLKYVTLYLMHFCF